MLAVLLAATLAAPALASVGELPPAQSTTPVTDLRETPEITARQRAERDYGDAYRDIGKAKDEVAKGKTKNAEKRFAKALARAESAVTLDSTYFEAWNLVGYASRNLGAYDRALEAYGRCLKISPNYAPAHEYLAEAYIDLKMSAKAREQLAWLEKFGSTEEIAVLRGKIEMLETAERAHAKDPMAGTGTKADSAP